MNDGKGTLRQDSERHTLGFERVLTHPPERVWRALTEGDELAVWFPAKIEGSREPGASLRFVSPPKPGQVPADTDEEGLTMAGEMLVVDPPRVLEYLWEVDVLRWMLDPHSDATLLTFAHTFDDEGRAARDASGWDMCLAALEARLAGLQPEPFTAERHAALFAHYAERFGPAAAMQQTPEM
jgi:uncharacterized protein YndB with AHSA1/START domain